jgi:hypothetical protein
MNSASITRIIIKRFRSFPTAALAFDNPLFVVGRNGSGKSMPPDRAYSEKGDQPPMSAACGIGLPRLGQTGSACFFHNPLYAKGVSGIESEPQELCAGNRNTILTVKRAGLGLVRQSWVTGRHISPNTNNIR